MATVHQELLAALKKIDRPGSFAVSGSVPAVLPGLEVTGVGPVGLPLNAGQAKELAKHCEQAPYGKGEETLVDTDVRRVWHLKPERFALSNPAWAATLGQIVAAAQQGLGLEGQKLESHLYDLLLYEPGGFFLPHRDGEKLERMVATLVVVLPSSFAGGELIVKHDGREQAIDFAGDGGPFRIHYAAFYADCEHEIRPLTEGYRLCLVYNLTLAKSKKPLAAPRTSAHIAPIRDILAAWATEDSPRKLAVTLDHQYTQDGLSWDALKGVDRGRADVLLEAARQAGCRVHLALLTYHEIASVEETGGGYGDSRWEEDEDGEEEDEEEAGEYEMIDLIDSDLSADHWSDPEGNRLALGEMNVEDDEVLDSEALEKVKPEEEVDGYTGNEGLTRDRWFRHGAIMLWPEDRHFEIVCGVGSHSAAHALAAMVAGWRKAGEPQAASLKAKCLTFAAAALARYEPARISYQQGEAPPCPLLPSLDELDDVGLIRAYLRDVLTKDTTLDPGAPLVTICQRHGWAAFREELGAAFRATSRESIERNVKVLERFCLAKPRKKAGHAELCAALAGHVVAAFEKLDLSAPAVYSRRPLSPDGLLTGLAKTLLGSCQPELFGRVVEHSLAHPETYPLAAHLAALSGLRSWLADSVESACPGLSRWLAGCRSQLEALTARMPQPPADLRRAATLSCKCADCGALARFLADPTERVYRFSARQDKRDHLANSIRHDRCEVDCTTEERGRPYTLICTKNAARYQASLKKYHEDQGHLAALRAIEAALPR